MHYCFTKCVIVALFQRIQLVDGFYHKRIRGQQNLIFLEILFPFHHPLIKKLVEFIGKVLPCSGRSYDFVVNEKQPHEVVNNRVRHLFSRDVALMPGIVLAKWFKNMEGFIFLV